MAARRRLKRLSAQLAPPGSAPSAATPQPRPWQPVDVDFSDAATVGRRQGADNPMVALSRGDVPAVILRRALPQAECSGLIWRFAERGMLPPAFVPFVSQDLSDALAAFAGPPGSGGSKWVGLEETGEDPSATLAERLDIGAALGNLGANQPAFFADAAKWHGHYATLFEGLPTQPIELMYGALGALSGGKAVRTACEPDGSQYCPVIYRSHMPEYGYAPHIDSVRHREKRTDYEVFRFGAQLGGILLLQAPEREPLRSAGKTPGYTPASDVYHDTIMYDAPCTRTDVAEFLADDGNNAILGGMVETSAFREFAETANLRAFPVDLEVGDMYFFKSDAMHEVPGFTGSLARVVQATFIGFSEEDDEIMVWS